MASVKMSPSAEKRLCPSVRRAVGSRGPSPMVAVSQMRTW